MDPTTQQASQPTQPVPPPQQGINRRTIIIAIGGFALFIIISLILLFTSSGTKKQIPGNTTPTRAPLRITTDPRAGARRADYTGDILMTFGEKVSVDDVSFSLLPTTDGSLRQISPTIVSFKPTNLLHSNTKYTATVSWVDGQKKDQRYTWTFTTDMPSGEENISNEDAQAFLKARQAAEQATQERRKKFPFLTQLPYTTRDFKIEISPIDSIIITTYGNTASLTEQYKTDALNWMKENGGTPSNYTIQYINGE